MLSKGNGEIKRRPRKRKNKERMKYGFPEILQKIYYRYSLETGISILEWWEVVIVNLYFMLLVYSLVKQVLATGNSLLYFFYRFLGLLRAKY